MWCNYFDVAARAFLFRRVSLVVWMNELEVETSTSELTLSSVSTANQSNVIRPDQFSMLDDNNIFNNGINISININTSINSICSADSAPDQSDVTSWWWHRDQFSQFNARKLIPLPAQTFCEVSQFQHNSCIFKEKVEMDSWFDVCRFDSPLYKALIKSFGPKYWFL